MKVAVITPYCREPLETLRRCRQSVAAQTHDCTHIFVADGYPRSEIAEWAVQHLVLPLAHADYGNTPRGIGSISAFNQGFEAVAFLDADNWYDPDHVASLVALCRAHDLAVAFSDRRIVLSTGEPCPFLETAELERQHVDTNCFFIRDQAAFVATASAMMPPNYASVCDRFLFQMVKARGLAHGWTGRATITYESRWPLHFRAMGKEPPADAHSVDYRRIREPGTENQILARLGYEPFGPGVSPPVARHGE